VASPTCHRRGAATAIIGTGRRRVVQCRRAAMVHHPVTTGEAHQGRSWICDSRSCAVLRTEAITAAIAELPATVRRAAALDTVLPAVVRVTVRPEARRAMAERGEELAAVVSQVHLVARRLIPARLADIAVEITGDPAFDLFELYGRGGRERANRCVPFFCFQIGKVRDLCRVYC
jgi:hypothetical protein